MWGVVAGESSLAPEGASYYQTIEKAFFFGCFEAQPTFNSLLLSSRPKKKANGFWFGRPSRCPEDDHMKVHEGRRSIQATGWLCLFLHDFPS